MFTVIFLSRAARRIFDRSRTFFDPFLETGEIAFCDWNESSRAETLREALPGLPDVIRGKSAWRAVVVDHASAEAPGRRDLENPFDFVDNTKVPLNLTDSPHPLVRIAHQLLGYPAMTARDFEPVVSHRGEGGVRVERHSDDGEIHDMLRTLGQTESDVRVEYREVAYSDDEQTTHRMLREKYHMKELHPSEIVFISTRARIDETDDGQLARAWRTETEQHVSRFVERNDYPPASRFAVYDLLNPENSGYDQDELRFWTAVLTVAVNVLPPSAFQAERVYRLGVDFSEQALGDLLNAHMGQLTALREHLDSLIDTPHRPPETELLRDEKVPVQFEKVGGGELRVRTSGYGLVADWPANESAQWSADFDTLQVDAGQFLRRPRRVLARAVYDTRRRLKQLIGEDHVLSDIDRDEIQDELSKRVGNLVVPATTQILDRTRVLGLLDAENAEMRRLLAQRMRIQMVSWTTLLVLAVWVISFVPYLLQAGARGATVLSWSAFVVGGVVLLVAGAGLGVLLWMRRRLLDRLNDVNSRMRSFANEVNDGADVFGQYLSQLATYMQARAVLIGAERVQQHNRTRRDLYRTVRSRAVAMIDAEKKIVTSLGQPLSIRRIPGGFSGMDIEDRRQVNAFFRFPTGTGTAAFNESGERVSAPYDFVARLSLERIRLFERSESASTEAEGL